MARKFVWDNWDGLRVNGGNNSGDNATPAVVNEGGNAVKTLQMEIVGVDVPAVGSVAATHIDPRSAKIRRGSIIKSAKLQTTVAFTGAGTLNIGAYSLNASGAIVTDDADGIDAAVDVDAALAAEGDIVTCDGALVNGAVSAGETSNLDIYIVPNVAASSITTGRAVLTIEYIEPSFDDPLVV